MTNQDDSSLKKSLQLFFSLPLDHFTQLKTYTENDMDKIMHDKND